MLGSKRNGYLVHIVSDKELDDRRLALHKYNVDDNVYIYVTMSEATRDHYIEDGYHTYVNMVSMWQVRLPSGSQYCSDDELLYMRGDYRDYVLFVTTRGDTAARYKVLGYEVS